MTDSNFPNWHGTTIIAVRKNNKTVIAGDGQVSMGATIVKGGARKVRTLQGGKVITGFAGATADAFTLLERLEAKLEMYPDQLARACVDLAKDWRTDRYLRRLEAMLLVADKNTVLTITGVGDVLDMSRLEAGSLTLARAPAAVAETVASAVDQVAPLFAEKNQVLDVRSERVPPELEIDHKRVRQVLVNLLSNASKFTPPGGRILVLARPAADGGVTIAVADTGIGMTHEEIMLALKPFAQVDDRRARAQEGAGLGLPLALGLARLHGGTLHIESQPRAGTTVVLTLPRRAADTSRSNLAPKLPEGRAA